MDSSQDKSLPATERKLQKTRSDGQGARSRDLSHLAILGTGALMMLMGAEPLIQHLRMALAQQLAFDAHTARSEEHTSELQSQSNLVCRLLLEKKKKIGILVRRERRTVPSSRERRLV